MVPFLSRFWRWCLHFGFMPGSDAGIQRAALFTYVFSLLAFVPLFLFGLDHILIQGSFFIGWCEIACSLVLVSNVLMLRFIKNIAFTTTIFLLALVAVLNLLLATGGLFNTGIFWFFAFPAATFFLKGRRGGIYWTGILLLASGLVIALHLTHYLTMPYSLVTVRQMWITLLVVSIAIYVYETNREHAEALAKKHREALIVVEGLAALGNWEWDIRTNKVTWSQQLNTILGLPPQNLPTTLEGFLAHVHPADRQTVKSTIEKAYKNHQPFEVKHRIVRPRGEVRLLHARGKVILDEQTGQPRLMIGTGQDITDQERQHSELQQRVQQISVQNEELEKNRNAMINLVEDAQALQRRLQEEKAMVEKKVQERTKELAVEHARLEASINSLNLGYILTDAQENILSMNRASKYLFDINLQTAASNTLKKFTSLKLNVVLSSLQLVNRGLAAKIKKAIDEQVEMEIKDLIFKDKILHISILPVVSLGYKKAEVIGAVILIEDQTQARMLDRARDEFFSIASHELRTPLTAMRGNTALIKQYYYDKLPNKELKEMIDDIHESSVRLLEIVNDFLDVSRLEQGRIKFEKTTFDPLKLTREVMNEFKASISAKKLTLKLKRPANELPVIFADVNRVKQVLLNLLSNAYKFTEEGSITVELQATPLFLRFLVHDTGRGISKENQKLLFRKFQQAGNSIFTRDSTKGTGLGLYIAKLMIEGMGGKIGLDKSEVGQGSTFSFTLPIVSPRALSK